MSETVEYVKAVLTGEDFQSSKVPVSFVVVSDSGEFLQVLVGKTLTS